MVDCQLMADKKTVNDKTSLYKYGYFPFISKDIAQKIDEGINQGDQDWKNEFNVFICTKSFIRIVNFKYE